MSTFIWQGKELKTFGDISNAIQAIYSRRDQEAADKFMMEFYKLNPHAHENVGYITGYFAPDVAAGMRKLFKVIHPIFGDTNPTLEEAFQEGFRRGQKLTPKNKMSRDTDW